MLEILEGRLAQVERMIAAAEIRRSAAVAEYMETVCELFRGIHLMQLVLEDAQLAHKRLTAQKILGAEHRDKVRKSNRMIYTHQSEIQEMMRKTLLDPEKVHRPMRTTRKELWDIHASRSRILAEIAALSNG